MSKSIAIQGTYTNRLCICGHMHLIGTGLGKAGGCSRFREGCPCRNYREAALRAAKPYTEVLR